jgi:hypothetical protein
VDDKLAVDALCRKPVGVLVGVVGSDPNSRDGEKNVSRFVGVPGACRQIACMHACVRE